MSDAVPMGEHDNSAPTISTPPPRVHFRSLGESARICKLGESARILLSVTSSVSHVYVSTTTLELDDGTRIFFSFRPNAAYVSKDYR